MFGMDYTYQADYIVDPSKKMGFKYIGTDYVQSNKNVFGVQFVGERTCFNQKDFVCPFKNTNNNPNNK